MYTAKTNKDRSYLGNGQESLYCAENLYFFSATQLYTNSFLENFLNAYKTFDKQGERDTAQSSNPLFRAPSRGSGALLKSFSGDYQTTLRLSGATVGSGPSRSIFETDFVKKRLERRLDPDTIGLFKYKSPYTMDRLPSPFISGSSLRSSLTTPFRTSGPI